MIDMEYQILVVDDQDSWRMLLSEVLYDNGYNVLSAGSLNEAIDLLKKGNFSLAILDVRLCDVEEYNTDGIKIAVEIRRCWPKIKIIILTGYATPALQTEVNELGVEGLFSKAFYEDESFEKFISTIGNLITEQTR
jgi:CheY-like chemotaxis protein